MTDIVNKLWGFCHTLRHDGVDYGDYIEQLTYLLFLKMADEKDVKVPKGCDWEHLKGLSGQPLLDGYTDALRRLRTEKGLLGDIFSGDPPRISVAVPM
ncbi:MAG: type I restriction-modification system subunit M N-terminal domain-containing protein [Holophagaceae bacterium]